MLSLGSHEAYLMTLKQQQDRNITLLKTEFERKGSEVHRIFEKAMKTVRSVPPFSIHPYIHTYIHT